jgi:two-component system sensor histidine kinase UhpB
VVAVNATILVVAAALLAFTPATVSFPIARDQGAILIVGLVALLVANAALLRWSFRGLESLVSRMETLDVLQPRERLPLMGGPESRALIEGFNAMLDRLEEERRLSARRTFSALEGERQRVGRELHDEIGQRLTGILLQLGSVIDQAPEAQMARLLSLQAETRATLDEVGTLAWQLRPGVLDDLGLASALEALVEPFAHQQELRVISSLPVSIEPMGREVELAVYRVAQESLTNALRHSGAQSVELSLAVDRAGLSLLVADDGRGLDGSESEGAGIRGMRERALLIGGRLRVDSPFGRGVRVRLDVPRDRLGG